MRKLVFFCLHFLGDTVLVVLGVLALTIAHPTAGIGGNLSHPEQIRQQLLTIFAVWLPVCLLTAACLSLFRANRLQLGRFAGYSLLTLLVWLGLAGVVSALARFFPTFRYAELPIGQLPLLQLIPSYDKTLQFFDACLGTDWISRLVSLAPVAFMSAGLWGGTRLFRQRPLLGALLAPALLAGWFALVAVYSGPGIRLVLEYLNISMPLHYRVAALGLLSALVMLLSDLVFAYHPLGQDKKNRGTHG